MSVPTTRLFRNVQGASSSTEILEKAGADFEVEKRPIYLEVEADTPDYQLIPHYAAIVHKDTNRTFAIMSSRYGVIQYKDATDFLDVMMDKKEAQPVYARCTDGGGRLHIIMQTNDYLDLGAGDKISCYFTVTSTHDGTGCFQAMITPVHEASQTVFTPDKTGVIRFRHSAKVQQRLNVAAAIVSKVHRFFERYQDNFKLMANVRITDEEAKRFFAMIFPDNESKGKPSKQAENSRAKCFDLYKFTGPAKDYPSCKETLFGALIAVQSYVEYYKTVRNSTKGRSEADAKIEARLFGDGARMKAEAYGVALKLMKKEI